MEDFNLVAEKVIKDHGNPEDQAFFEKRAAGAMKIQKQAAAKGGPSKLTAIHFKAKEAPYRMCLKNLDSKAFAEKKAAECYRKLSSWKHLTQDQFQKLMGELEVYGEVFLKLK